MRKTVAARMPTSMALVRCSRGKPAAARPITIALSPARTKSIVITCARTTSASLDITASSMLHAPQNDWNNDDGESQRQEDCRKRMGHKDRRVTLTDRHGA